MCGIAGALAFDHQSQDGLEAVRSLAPLMFRRGPDDGGFWTDGHCCAMTCRRLSVLDLSPAGHQPMESADGRYIIVYNGETYNFQEIRQQLEQEGVVFDSTGDTEVILMALAQWGTAALDRFNGMFAIALFDRREGRLLLARDHAGIKPLYYLLTNRGLVFGSQYDQILAHPWSRSQGTSSDALALYLRLGYIPAPYAMLDGSQMLEPGCWLEVSLSGAIRRGRYYGFPQNPDADLKGEEAFEAVDAAVTDAVRRQLVSDVPVGTFLSGGIDSPLVAAKMRQAGVDPIRAFTIGVGADPLDESMDAAAYARELQCVHTLERITPQQAAGMLDYVVAATGEPFADYSIFPTMIVSELARREVTVMLSGDGGDELFWGYAGRFSSVLALAEEFRQPHWVRSARYGAQKLLGGSVGAWGVWKPWNLRWPSLGDWYRARHSHLPEEWIQRILPDAPEWPKIYDLYRFEGGGTDRTAYWLRWNEYAGHLTRVLLKVDRASMYHSLEVRVPLLDRQVVDIAARVDWQSCLSLDPPLGKIPLRRSLSRTVQHQTTGKRGFAVPMAEWLRGPFRSVMEGALLARRDLMGMPINRPALRQMFDQHLSGHMDFAWGLWLLLSLALWEDHYYCKERRPTITATAPT
ncbi:MAG TPA: asparagine synthase (glutamine-hydrolyzing) [Armatimonadota bacterium]|nr:asparagine synthase (glutamine-hydrolyzing) [Armatimonadota bacterium]